MRNLTLILCIIAMLGTIASGVMFFLIGNTKQELHHRWQDALASNEVLSARLAAAEENNTELTGRIGTLDSDLATHKRELTDLKIEAERLANTLALAEEERTQALADRDAALTDLTAEKSKLADANQRLAASVSAEEVARYRQLISDLQSRIAPLERRLTQKREAPGLVAGRGNHAQVIKVGPRNAFVVINFGSSHAAAPNQRMLIKRGTSSLATVEISLVKEHYSIAQVLPETLSGSIRKGDAATIIP
ncbi:MAG: hypothetical protein SynsKO_25100 [Synoicihabitans sp.]